MAALRSSSVIAALAAHLNAGHSLTIRDGEVTYCMGPAKRADGHHGWELNTYRPGGHNETDDAFFSAHAIAREMVRTTLDKYRVHTALLAVAESAH